jgi:ArsR family transcriptional regulator
MKGLPVESEVALLKALAESTRLRLAVLLALRGEMCVCELVEALSAPQFRVSRHLGVLRTAGLVESRREGTWMHYRLADPQSAFHASLVQSLRASLADSDTVRLDLSRLEASDCRVPESTTDCP